MTFWWAHMRHSLHAQGTGRSCALCAALGALEEHNEGLGGVLYVRRRLNWRTALSPVTCLA